jgi:adenylate cyclase
MWGAPRLQPDHAERAVRAALGMLGSLPALNAQWREAIGEPLEFGIGLNTGKAHVGNTGSRHKFKYGPLGSAVNLASRVQGLSKYLNCRLVAAAATRRQLGSAFIARRVCRARVVNINEPVEVHEVEAAGDPARAAFFRDSEAALAALEAADFVQATRLAAALLQTHPNDGPVRLTLARASAALAHTGTAFDPVWVPPGK